MRISSVRLLALLALALVSFATRADNLADGVIDKQNKTLDRARTTLDEVERALIQSVPSAAELRQLRERVEPLPLDLQRVIDRLTPRLQAVDARLNELAPPSADAKSDASTPPPSPPAPAPAAPPVKAAPPAKPAA
ncbi:MAG: mechanosensitive ion channel family protein, partial [Methylocystis sp.]